MCTTGTPFLTATRAHASVELTSPTTATQEGLAVFAEHTADARNRPGAHPNVDRLLEIAAGGSPLRVEVIAAG